MDFGCFSLIAGRFSCDPGTFLGSRRGFHGPRMPFRAAMSGLSLEGAIGNGGTWSFTSTMLFTSAIVRRTAPDPALCLEVWTDEAATTSARPAGPGRTDDAARRKPISSPPPAGPGGRRDVRAGRCASRCRSRERIRKGGGAGAQELSRWRSCSRSTCG